MKIGIRAKLIGSFITIALIFTLCLGIVSLVVQRLTTTIGQMQKAQRKLELSDNLQLNVSKLLKPANHYLITGDIRERDHFDRLVNEISKTIKELKNFDVGPEWEALIVQMNEDILRLSEMIIEVLFIEQPVGNKKAAWIMERADLFFENLTGKMERFNDLTETQMSRMVRLAESESRWAHFVFYATIGLAAVFVLLLSLSMTHFIIRPILELHRGTQIVGGGNLSYRLAIKTTDEIGDLAREFNRMVQSLADMKKNLDLKLEETHKLAVTDGLTGLYNQRFCIEKLMEEVNRAERYNRPLSVIIADIDDFKLYNDTHGHLRGDDLLKIFASVLKQEMRTSDFVCRSGGEEFTMILPETDKESALQIAERVRIRIEGHPFPYREKQPGRKLTASLGVARFAKEEMNLEKFIKSADDALYQAKRKGKNKVAILT